jgi:[acyl-carrier-protein] S-malonyltransferase
MEELTGTANAQLATFVMSLVVLDAVERLGLSPAACAGHSLGEYTALVASGAVSFDDGVRLVMARGEAMARACEDAPGTMAAVLGMSDDDAEAACQRAEGDAWVANYNAPGQVVVAGTADAIATATSIARDLGARKVLPIPVAGAFHTPLMAAARPALRKALGDVVFGAPEVPVVANVDARVHNSPTEWPQLLSAQICSPVRWRQTLETLAGLGASTLVELGPGGVLTGLVRRAAPELTGVAVAKPEDLDTLMEVVANPETGRADAQMHEGEHLYVSERVVVSPCAGIFSPERSVAAPGTGLLPGTTPPEGGAADGQTTSVGVGDLVGRVGVAEVRTPFAGGVVRWLAMEGERVQEGQPLVWLHASGAEE